MIASRIIEGVFFGHFRARLDTPEGTAFALALTRAIAATTEPSMDIITGTITSATRREDHRYIVGVDWDQPGITGAWLYGGPGRPQPGQRVEACPGDQFVHPATRRSDPETVEAFLDNAEAAFWDHARTVLPVPRALPHAVTKRQLRQAMSDAVISSIPPEGAHTVPPPPMAPPDRKAALRRLLVKYDGAQTPETRADWLEELFGEVRALAKETR